MIIEPVPDDVRIRRFGVFEVDLRAGELRRNGVKVKLQEQPFQVLAVLLEKPGEIVSKQELQERIWREETFVDFDRSLATAINKVRQALDDSATRPRFVETIPKRGYRFVGEPGLSSPGADVPAQSTGLSRKVAVAAVGFLGVLAIFLGMRRDEPPTPPTLAFSEPLTTYPGTERAPSISPDGSRVAFAWQKEDSDNYDIYIKLIGAGEPIQLTDAPEDDLWPQWSPDGQFVAFGRLVRRREAEILRIPASGGQEVRLESYTTGGQMMQYHQRPFAWVPDGDGLVICDHEGRDGGRLYFSSLLSGTRKLLRTPTELTEFVSNPSFTTAGVMGFTETNRDDGSVTLFTWDLGDPSSARGEPEAVHSSSHRVFGAAISPRGDEFLFSSPTPAATLWRVPLSTRGPVERVVEAADHSVQPAFSSDGRRLVHGVSRNRSDIWRLELSEPGVAGGPAQRWIRSTYDDIWPDISPDGSRVVFQSDRSGSDQIWMADSEGEQAVQLTDLDSPLSGSPVWSPSGSRVAFDSMIGAQWAVFVMNANGSGVRRLTDSSLRAVRPRWSPGGEWVYFVVLNGAGGTARIPVGGGPAESVVGDLRHGRLDRSGRFVYGFRDNGAGEDTVWRVDLETGREEALFDAPEYAMEASAEGIYFSRPGLLMEPSPILFYRFSDRQVLEVATPPLSRARRFGLSPDGRYLTFSQAQDVGGDLMIIQNYR